MPETWPRDYDDFRRLIADRIRDEEPLTFQALVDALWPMYRALVGHIPHQSLDQIDRKTAVADERDLLEELRLHLAWASRLSPDSPSRKALRKMFERPDVLDLIERLVRG